MLIDPQGEQRVGLPFEQLDPALLARDIRLLRGQQLRRSSAVRSRTSRDAGTRRSVRRRPAPSRRLQPRDQHLVCRARGPLVRDRAGSSSVEAGERPITRRPAPRPTDDLELGAGPGLRQSAIAALEAVRRGGSRRVAGACAVAPARAPRPRRSADRGRDRERAEQDQSARRRPRALRAVQLPPGSGSTASSAAGRSVRGAPPARRTPAPSTSVTTRTHGRASGSSYPADRRVGAGKPCAGANRQGRWVSPTVIGARRDRPGQGHRLRQPEGRRREDDHHAEPCGGLRRAGPPRPVRRHGPAGQPHHVAGHRPRHARAVDVRRARARPLDPRGHPPPRDRRRVRLDRPRRGRDRDVDEDRPRALADARRCAQFPRTTTGSSSIRRRRWDY